MKEIIIEIITAIMCIIALIGVASIRSYADKKIQKYIIKESLRELNEEQNVNK